MNESHKIPSNARYSLELRLGWSVTRIVIMTATPVILSLVVGIWYMQFTGDTQTAWTIASYIVTAAGGEYFEDALCMPVLYLTVIVILALLAIATQIGGV